MRGKRGRGAGGKIPVIGLHKRGEKVYLSVVKNCSKAELMPIITGRVLEGTDLYTDGWKADDGLVLKGYEHHRIHHHQNQFARGKNHVNGIESFWSYAKFRFLKLRGLRLEVVKRTDKDLHRCKILPKRWIVKRTFGWLSKFRRLSKDYEFRTDNSETMILIAATRLMLARLA